MSFLFEDSFIGETHDGSFSDIFNVYQRLNCSHKRLHDKAQTALKSYFSILVMSKSLH